LQVRVAVPSVSGAAPLDGLPIAVTVTAPFVVPRHVATPFVASDAELTETFTVSETVHVGVSFAMMAGTAQPGEAPGAAVATNCC